MKINAVMDKHVRRAMLFDRYGELLNEKQKKIVEYTVYEDMSLSEIGEAEGISRQAASVLLKRADERLEEFEDVLQIIQRSKRINESVAKIRSNSSDPAVIEELAKIENELGI